MRDKARERDARCLGYKECTSFWFLDIMYIQVKSVLRVCSHSCTNKRHDGPLFPTIIACHYFGVLIISCVSLLGSTVFLPVARFVAVIT